MYEITAHGINWTLRELNEMAIGDERTDEINVATTVRVDFYEIFIIIHDPRYYIYEAAVNIYRALQIRFTHVDNDGNLYDYLEWKAICKGY